MRVTIAEELLLLAHNEKEGRQLINSIQLDPALAGAILAELAVNGRVELTEKKLTVKDPTPLGDAELDATLARIVADGKDRTPSWWVQRLQSHKLRHRLLERLADAGVLTEERGKVLGIFPTRRWPEAQPGVEADIRERISAVLAGAEPDPRTGVLIAITKVVGLTRKIFPNASKERVKEITEGAWAAEAVAKTIAAINAGVVITTTVTVVAIS
ncbi:Golgi phosphoprotein 3 (GPP34) [Nonomuraea solani]|uniref:Golgi phosphoprotein 3 (GPP34) n=1 Tax=Nonomuraea solani TaxID=1144553 RepID=A0A1H6CWW8_9ACTN|nr:GPP34 family phosphoprotein [Nonomuraea solani]SEG77324.1 Golgi phosphoprotein 3 (GPP34) [Nonomuraea solani]